MKRSLLPLMLPAREHTKWRAVTAAITKTKQMNQNRISGMPFGRKSYHAAAQKAKRPKIRKEIRFKIVGV